MEKFKLPSRFTQTQENVWEEYRKITAKYNPVDLGRGYPDYPPPSYLTEMLAKVGKSDSLLHQYTRDYGHPRLVKVLSDLYSRLLGLRIDSETEILVTVGANEALFCSIFGHVDSGDEVIIVEPFFDCYESLVKAVGGVAKFIPLRPKQSRHLSSSDWTLDESELCSLFTEKTKVLMLNNPNNPLGKVYQPEELEMIAGLCKKWNVLCISDEVHEFVVYKPRKHTRIASLPGMWERTITIGSAGKTFGVTGWKIGWAYGPSNLLHNLKMVHQNSVYTGNTPMQEVIAFCLEKELERLDQDGCYFRSLPQELQQKRDFMVAFLTEIGMKPTVPEGGYFVVADWTLLESLVDLETEQDKWGDYRFTKWMGKNVGVLGLPVSAFYSKKNKTFGEKYVRYCFSKKTENLERAAEIIKNWVGNQLYTPATDVITA